MKKIIVLVAIFALTATSAFATASGATGTLAFTTTGKTLTGDTATATADTATIGKMSTGVDCGWKVDTGGNGYAIMTQHKSGTKAFGSSYDSTAIYQTTSTSVNPGTAAYNGGVMTATDTADFASGWKAM